MTKLRLNWTAPGGPEGSQCSIGVDLVTILPAMFEGLIETKHPFSLIAQQGVKDLLSTQVAADSEGCQTPGSANAEETALGGSPLFRLS